ncbi:MAG: hypothetical protein IKN38_02680, partial [Clostridia bacterium]|nr:hypothetical protein [Clostridia bacterium]
MKKLISLVIVVLMVASSIVSVFALPDRDSVPTPSEINKFSVWAEDTTFDPDTQEYVDVYFNIANNTEYGCEYLKLYLFYPECLTLDIMEPAGITGDGELTVGSEKTESDELLERALMTNCGIDVGVPGERNEQQQSNY